MIIVKTYHHVNYVHDTDFIYRDTFYTLTEDAKLYEPVFSASTLSWIKTHPEKAIENQPSVGEVSK